MLVQAPRVNTSHSFEPFHCRHALLLAWRAHLRRGWSGSPSSKITVRMRAYEARIPLRPPPVGRRPSRRWFHFRPLSTCRLACGNLSRILSTNLSRNLSRHLSMALAAGGSRMPPAPCCRGAASLPAALRGLGRGAGVARIGAGLWVRRGAGVARV